MVLPDAVYTLEYGEDGDGMSLVVRDADGTHPRVLNQVGMWIFRGADDEYLYGFCDKAFGRVSRADGSETYLTHDSLSEFVTDGYVAGVWQTAFVCVVCHSSDQIPARVCLLDRDGQITEVAQIDPESLSSPYAVCDGVLSGRTQRPADSPPPFRRQRAPGERHAVHTDAGRPVRCVQLVLVSVGRDPDRPFGCGVP